MNQYSKQWVQEWCQANGWTDLFVERSQYWAFPPGAVMPVPVPIQDLQVIKAEKGLSLSEKVWRLLAVVVALGAITLSYTFRSPMPLVIAFAFCAIAVAQLETEDN